MAVRRLLLLLLLAVVLRAPCRAAATHTSRPLGCWGDDESDPDLDGAKAVSGSAASEEGCLSYCASTAVGHPYRYFGLHYGIECHCGNSYGRHGRVGDDNCALACFNNVSQSCGGKHHNSVFEIVSTATGSPATHIPPPPPTPSPPQQRGQEVTGAPVPATQAPLSATARPAAGNASAVPLYMVEGIVDEVHLGATATVAAIGAAGSAGYSASTALRLAMVSTGCSGNMPAALNPTGLVVAGSPYVGAVVANVGLCCCMVVLSWVAVKAAMRWGHRFISHKRCADDVDFAGLLHVPSAPLFVFQFFYHGIALAAMHLMLHPDQPWHIAVGIAACLVCIAVPVVLVCVMSRDIPDVALYTRDPDRRGFTLSLLGPGEWLNTYRDCMWVQQFSSVLRTYKQDRVWYIGVEFGMSLVLSAITSTRAQTSMGCGHVKLASAFVFLVLLCLQAYFWPHARHRDSAADIVLLGLQMSAMLVMAIGYYGQDESLWMFDVAAHIVTVVMVLLMVKVALDLLAELWVLLTGCRTELQDALLTDLETKDALSAEGVCNSPFGLNLLRTPLSSTNGSMSDCASLRLPSLAQSIRATRDRDTDLDDMSVVDLLGAAGRGSTCTYPISHTHTTPFLAAQSPLLESSSNNLLV